MNNEELIKFRNSPATGSRIHENWKTLTLRHQRFNDQHAPFVYN